MNKIRPLTFVVVPVVDALEIVDSGIIEILTGEYDSIQISGMSIGDRVTYDYLVWVDAFKKTFIVLSLLFVSYLPKPTSY